MVFSCQFSNWVGRGRFFVYTDIGNGLRILNVTILALLATILLGVALLLSFSGNFHYRFLWVALMLPIIWAALIFYCYWDSKAWRVLLVNLVIIVVGFTMVLLNPVST